MKKIILTISFIFSLFIGTQAKENMIIHLNNGSTQKIDVSTVDSITFQEVVNEVHYFVDLGLPSGTLWATTNVGASVPEEYGEYYAWGETEPKDTYFWSNYKWGTDKNLKKYNRSAALGVVDNKMELDPEDDAATANWGDEWCTPSVAQYKELFDEANMTWEIKQQNGVYGYYGVSKKNGNTIFMPSAGSKVDDQYIWYEKEGGTASYGRYHTRDLYNLNNAYYDNYYIWFNSANGNNSFSNINNSAGYRSNGKSIRPVMK